jgi:hypothetical protein
LVSHARAIGIAFQNRPVCIPDKRLAVIPQQIFYVVSVGGRLKVGLQSQSRSVDLTGGIISGGWRGFKLSALFVCPSGNSLADLMHQLVYVNFGWGHAQFLRPKYRLNRLAVRGSGFYPKQRNNLK